jgi:type II secretory pathway pseudopilin PulG
MRIRRRFTMIEVLVAMTIVLILTTLLAMGLGGSKDKATHKASIALVNKIKVALESYFAEFRDYPPDGYDVGENGWSVTSAGVEVGFAPARRVRGTASLIYFLCRPVIKVTRMSSDPGDTGATFKKVGPFLELDNRDFSNTEITVGGELRRFQPNFPWANAEFWDKAQGQGINCEIVDAYGRPLCYDKVRTAETVDDKGNGKFKYYHASLFQDPAGGGTAVPPTGLDAHPDNARYITGGIMPVDEDEEPPGFANTGASMNTILNSRCDPRFATQAARDAVTAMMLNESAAPSVSAATTTTHKAHSTPGYDLWSAGKSWVDPRDDITSWGN